MFDTHKREKKHSDVALSTTICCEHYLFLIVRKTVGRRKYKIFAFNCRQFASQTMFLTYRKKWLFRTRAYKCFSVPK